MVRPRQKRVNRYLVGQRVTLYSIETPSFLNTIVMHDRASRTGKVAGEITVSEMIASALAVYSSVGNMHMPSPRLWRIVNDGRSGRIMELNVEFRMSPGNSLPPSTGSFRSMNVERMEMGYEFIVSSILDLVR